MKNGKKFIVFLLSAIMAFGTAGCGRKKDTETHIEIYAYKAGYGIEWIQAIAGIFKAKKAEEGVTVTFDIWGDAAQQQDALLRSGAKHNTVDLFIVTEDVPRIISDGKEVVKGYDIALEPLDDVFASDAGGGVTFKDKIIEYYTPKKLNGHYYSMPWAGGITGLVYNKTMFDTIGISAPRTTGELLDICGTIKNTDKVPAKSRVPFVFSAGTGYFEYLRDMWWLQYEGPENVENFFNCIDDGMLSKNMFLQTGRLKALEALESIVGYTKGYINVNSSSFSYTQAQTQLLLGEGLMQANGDWFENEMKTIMSQDKNKYDFRIMRTPIISSIMDKCSFKDESLLRKVVTEVDKELDGLTPDKSAISGVSDDDYNLILEARKASYSTGAGSAMYIPVYATAKDMAKEFLAFMATDEAIKAYIDSTSGNQPPFKYDLPSDTQRWNGLSFFQKDNYYNKQHAVFFQAFSGGPFPMSYTGDRNNSEKYFAAPNAADRRTPQQLYRGEYDSWSDAKWQQFLREKGLI